MKHISPVVVAVIRRGDQYLLTERADLDPEDKGYTRPWQFPGGGVEFAESPEEALRREIREEVGIEINIHTLLPTILSKVRGNWHGLIMAYVCSMKDESDSIILNDESSAYKWLRVDEVQHLETLAGIDDILAEAEQYLDVTQ